LVAEGFAPKRTLYLSFGHDEEVGGRRGAIAVAKRFADQGVRLGFLFDEGGSLYDGHPLVPGRTTASIVTAEKAFYTVELTARGVSGHSSIPPASTAIGKLARAIHRVEQNPMPARLIPPLREMLEAASPYLPFARRFAFDNLWLTGGMVRRAMLSDRINSALVRTTFAATLISGGVKDNVIPELAQATINVRILPGDTPDEVLAHLEEVIDDPEIEIQGTSWGVGAPPARVAGPGYRLAKAAVQEVMPEVVVLPGLIPGATDSRHFAEVADEIYRFVPNRVHIEEIGGAHGRDERVAVEPLAESREIAIGMVRRAGAAVSE
jgi:carboxypeptidase PM20D1